MGKVPVQSSATRKKLTPEVLFAANQGLVGLCLARFSFLAGDAREDAFGAGQLGLWRAAQGFDPARGYKFSTYATRVIRGFILQRLRSERRQARVSCVSLETPLSEDGGTLADVLSDPHAEKPGHAQAEQSSFEALLSLVPAKHAAVLRTVYWEDSGLPGLGNARRISRQRAHQMHALALEKLRQALQEKAAREAWQNAAYARCVNTTLALRKKHRCPDVGT